LYPFFLIFEEDDKRGPLVLIIITYITILFNSRDEFNCNRFYFSLTQSVTIDRLPIHFCCSSCPGRPPSIRPLVGRSLVGTNAHVRGRKVDRPNFVVASNFYNEDSVLRLSSAGAHFHF
jgi:hypothetical protein